MICAEFKLNNKKVMCVLGPSAVGFTVTLSRYTDQSDERW